MPKECLILKTEHQAIEKLQKEFELELKNAIESGKLEKAQALKTEIEQRLKSLKEKLFPKEITANFKNPEMTEAENRDKGDIKFDIPAIMEEQKAFYEEHGMENFNEQEVKKIFQRHKAEIQKEMETYGYDTITIIPAKLPVTEKLNQEMTVGYAETYQSDNFKADGGFGGLTHIESQKTRVILTHKDQNIYDDPIANPFLKATLDKNIPMLILNISKENWNHMEGETKEKKKQEAFQKIKQGAGINFETEIKNKKQQIQAEGLSLNEYLIFQRQYFEKNNQQKHLDESGWTWLPKSRSASRVVYSRWVPDDGRLSVHAGDPDAFAGFVGCRLSRSFELT